MVSHKSLPLIEHKNVLGLLGVYCPTRSEEENDQEEPTLYDNYMLMTPLMDKGNLNTYLKTIKGSDFTVELAVDYIFQAARGLEYLHWGGVALTGEVPKYLPWDACPDESPYHRVPPPSPTTKT